MSFLNPFALLAMAAVAVPLFLHFFNLRQPTEVDFSSLAFVKELQETAVQRVRIKEWLLLALRMLAIACLVMAFARPTVTGDLASVGASVRTAHGLVIDNSLSMQVDTEQGGSALDQAKTRGRGVIQTMEDGDEGMVWPTAKDGEGTPPLVENRGTVGQALSSIEPQAGATSLARATVEAADALARSDAPRRIVYVVGDMQKSTLGDSIATKVPENVQIRMVPVETRSAANVAVTDVSVVSQIAEGGQPVDLEATLVNYGSESLTDYVASVYLDEQRVAQTTTTLEPGLETTVSFTVTPRDRGWLRGAVQTEDDDFPVDDRHHFTMNVPEERRVLVVRGAGQETRYVDLALSAEMTADRIAFRTTGIDESALASAELGSYDAVLLVGPQSLSSGEVDALVRYVNRGGGVLLFPSERAEAETYNSFLQALGAGRVEGFTGTPSGSQPIASFGRVNLEHPLFEGVFRRDHRPDAEVEDPDVFYAMNLRPSGRSGRTLIELSNGVPFLHEVGHGRGAVLIMAVAPTPVWSDLPVRGLFVPLLYRSVYYVSAGSSVEGEQLVAGRPTEFRVSGVAPGTALRLVGPEGTEVAPDQRSLFGATLIQVGPTLTTPGIYDIRADDRLVRRMAVNVDPAESDLRTATPDQARSHLQTVLGQSVLTVSGTEAADVAETLQTQEAGTEIWNVFLLLALIFLVAEMLVASQWQPETAAA